MLKRPVLASIWFFRLLLMLGLLGGGMVLGAALDLARLGVTTQSGDAAVGREASRAVDGSLAAFSATGVGTNAFWEVELGRVYGLTRVEVVTTADPAYAGAADGLTLRVFDLRDRTVFQAALTDPGPGQGWSVSLPAGLTGRVVRIGLEEGRPNGSGQHQVVLAEVRVWGDGSPEAGPIRLREVGVAAQTSTATAATGAARAIDGDVATYSETGGEADGGWLLTLDRLRPVYRVEVVNRTGTAAARLGGLTLRLLDEHSNTVASAVVTNPGPGRTWGYTAPAGTRAQQIRIGLEDGRRNEAGDYGVTLAEVSVLTGENLALGREAYAVRFLDSQPAASVANDGDYTTEFKSTDKTVDAYWEVDLGEERVLSSVRAVAASGFTARLAHATVRWFDAGHRSVDARHLQGSLATFEVDVSGPRRARYVRVGFENKERSDPAGGIEWYLGLKEVEVYGRPADAVGLLAFGASTNRIVAGGVTTLIWREAGLDRLDLFPGVGSAGAWTGLGGEGAMEVRPSATTEYWLVGTDRDGVVARAVTVEVDGKELPVQISEWVANNRLSWEDGRGEAPDWIELHNPNGRAVDLAGYGLSDDPGQPRKWVFPSVVVPPHGFLVVAASGRSEPFDAGGQLHTSFQWDQAGESVVLTAPDGVTVVDAVVGYPPQREDLAYGRTVSGGWAFLEPTPGRLNWAASYAGWLRPPEFSVERGFKTNAFALVLIDPNEGAEVYYSMNGRAPATRYVGPLTVSGSMVVRATVRRAGYKEPPVRTHSYLFPERLLTAANMNQTLTQDPRYGQRILQSLVELPVLSIAVPNLPDDYVEREASVEIFWPDGLAPVQANAGFFRFGGAWTTFAKKNYRLKFRAEYGDRKLRAPLFRGFDRGILAQDGFDELDLGGGSHDMVERGFYLGSRFAEDTMLDMGSLNPHGRFVHVFINGNYWGQYHARERLNDEFLANYLGGAREDYVNVRGNDNVGSGFILGTPEPPHREGWERALATRGTYREVRSVVDVPHLVDFMLMWAYGDAEPEFRAAGPVMGGSGFKFWLGDADGYLRTSALNKDPGANGGPGGIFGALVAEGDPDFLMLVADRVQRHCFADGALTPGRNLARLDERMLEITNSLVAESARWGYRTPENWPAAAQAIRTGLFPDRTRNLVNGLRARGLYPAVEAPSLSHAGGSVTNGFELVLGGSGEVVYYTLDGSDPRLPGGGVNPSARRLDVGGNVLVPAGSVWRYWDRGSLPGNRWAQPDFVDSSWPSGRAQLGYGDGGEATVLGYGPDANDKYRAYYFRLAFGVSDPGRVPDLGLELLRDDGAVVYLNGREVVRDNMPAGPIQHTTFASSAVGGAEESMFYRFPLDATNLVAGTNWLAVEVHQATANSTDLSFDLALVASGVPSDPTLVLRSNTVLRARSRVGAAWSALVEARYVVGEPVVYRGAGVDFSELHYNPDGSDDFEFLELANTGQELLDLSGARLEGGVEFLFPAGTLLEPGAFLLVVENTNAFAARYQDPASPWFYPGLRVAGQWSGRLDDAGERVALWRADRVEGVAVRYRSDAAWPQRANGRGSSLELRDLGGGPRDPVARAGWLNRGTSWRSSGLYHGSPGRWEGVVRPVWLNEVLAHTDAEEDWIELHNPGEEAVDLYGKYLSDRYGDPFRYAFPEGTWIPPGGFLVVRASELGFGLSELGSDVLLVEGDGTNVGRFLDTVDVPALDREVTMGRWERSDGMVDFTELREGTAGAPNGPPRVGPVVISEMMYRPSAGQAEYIELVNLGTEAVVLHDLARPTNRWRLSGAVAFEFPVGHELGPGVPVVVCSTNPAAFRAQYGLGSEVVVYGPWEGRLDNAGESVKLTRPGVPEPDGRVPAYRVDRVQYEPDGAWPVVGEAGGASLERITLAGYGNDPANWRVSAGGTPGRVEAALNRAPVLVEVADWEYPAGTPIRWGVTAWDEDRPAQRLTFSQTGLPGGWVLDSGTGRVEGRAVEPGVYRVRVMVVDDGDPPLGASVEFTLTITPPFGFNVVWASGEEPRRFRFEGLAGGVYEIEYSDTLGPGDWRRLARVEDAQAGLNEVVDPEVPAPARRFYRLLWMNAP